MPKAGKKNVTVREVAIASVQAVLPDGTTAGITKIRFAVQR